MRIDPNILRRELGKTLNEIELAIQQVEVDAKEQGVAPYEVCAAGGGKALVPLIAAKAQTLYSLTLINEAKGK